MWNLVVNHKSRPFFKLTRNIDHNIHYKLCNRRVSSLKGDVVWLVFRIFIVIIFLFDFFPFLIALKISVMASLLLKLWDLNRCVELFQKLKAPFPDRFQQSIWHKMNIFRYLDFVVLL